MMDFGRHGFKEKNTVSPDTFIPGLTPKERASIGGMNYRERLDLETGINRI